jgi:hypothetical protein
MYPSVLIWQKEHPDKMKEYKKNYYYRNQEEMKEKRREYYRKQKLLINQFKELAAIEI